MTNCGECGHEISKKEVELGFCVNCGKKIDPDSLSIKLDEDYNPSKHNYFDFEGEW